MTAGINAIKLTGPGRAGRTALAGWVAASSSGAPLRPLICLHDLLTPAAGQKPGAVLDLGGNNWAAMTNKGDE